MHTLLIEDNLGGYTELYGHETVLHTAMEEWHNWYTAPEGTRQPNEVLKVSSYSNTAERAEVLFMIPMENIWSVSFTS